MKTDIFGRTEKQLLLLRAEKLMDDAHWFDRCRARERCQWNRTDYGILATNAHQEADELRAQAERL